MVGHDNEPDHARLSVRLCGPNLKVGPPGYLVNHSIAVNRCSMTLAHAGEVATEIQLTSRGRRMAHSTTSKPNTVAWRS